MKKVLIVDDEKNVRVSLSIGLKRKGFEVDMAANGVEAIMKIRNGYYNFLITDIRMPKMSGIELAKTVTKIHPSTDTILMSAYNFDDLEDKQFDLMQYPRLSKPFDISELILLMDDMHSRVKYRTESEAVPATA